MFLESYDMVKPLVPGGTFLLNTPYSEGRNLVEAADAGAGIAHRQEGEVLRD